MASSIWTFANTGKLTKDEIAESFKLPVAAIHEAIQYSEANTDLIFREAEQDHLRFHKTLGHVLP